MAGGDQRLGMPLLLVLSVAVVVVLSGAGLWVWRSVTVRCVLSMTILSIINTFDEEENDQAECPPCARISSRGASVGL